jgi:hypothetical protein
MDNWQHAQQVCLHKPGNNVLPMLVWQAGRPAQLRDRVLKLYYNVNYVILEEFTGQRVISSDRRLHWYVCSQNALKYGWRYNPLGFFGRLTIGNPNIPVALCYPAMAMMVGEGLWQAASVWGLVLSAMVVCNVLV